MIKKFTVALYTFLLLVVLGGPFSIVHADCGNTFGTGNNYNFQSQTQNCPPTLGEVSVIVIAVIEVILALSAVIFFFMLVVNGFNFMTSTGSAEKIEAARKGVVFTIIGFALIFSSFIILNIITHITGLQKGSGLYFDSNGNLQFQLIQQGN
jgi:hypothetical protein